MGWVKDALKGLSQNGQCQIRTHGGSMKGKIESGQLVTITKISSDAIKINDVAFLKWKGNYLLHTIIAISDSEFLIANNLGKTNGWIPKTDVIGIVTKIED